MKLTILLSSTIKSVTHYVKNRFEIYDISPVFNDQLNLQFSFIALQNWNNMDIKNVDETDFTIFNNFWCIRETRKID